MDIEKIKTIEAPKQITNLLARQMIKATISQYYKSRQIIFKSITSAAKNGRGTGIISISDDDCVNATKQMPMINNSINSHSNQYTNTLVHTIQFNSINDAVLVSNKVLLGGHQNPSIKSIR